MTDIPENQEPTPEGGLAEHPLTALRLAKHESILAGDGYPYRFARSDYAADLQERYGSLEAGEETTDQATVAGRLMALRRMGKLVFAVLQDATGRIQLFVDKRTLGDDGFAQFDELDIGDWVGASGVMITTKKGEVSVRIDSFELLAKALRPLPEKWHGLQDVEMRSRRRYLDLMVNEDARKIALTRARIVSELRRQFEARGYIEVETPVLLSQATGALARPFQTHHNALEQDMYLRIATELFLKRLVVGGLERVFEIGRIFRNEGVDSTHNPEFTMLESYEAFADYNDIMVMVEEMIAAVAVAAVGSTEITYQGRTLDLSPPYRRARMVDLVADAVGEPVGFDRPLSEMRDLADRHGLEPDLAWGHGKIIDQLFEELVADEIWEPTYVLDHPKETSPLAREHRDDPNLTERYELFIAGAEYANAFSELNDPLDQRARFEQQALARAEGDDEAHPIDEDYILALEYGLPPTGGLGIGVDRLVMLLTDQHHIREVILFPTLRREV
ncbi:MAG: lysine--tRNA ligase [Acidimicrobiia bacterium]|nr:lysine--tRNA ligase [Acidimicrobiia bacterium]